MQKDEIITIRTNSLVKKMVEDAKVNSGQTAGDWLQQAVQAWQEKHADMAGELEIADSAHIIAGRRALNEVGKVLEALELIVKQIAEAGKQDNSNWQLKYAELERELVEKDEQAKLFKEEVKNLSKQNKAAVSELEKTIDKQAKAIAELEANKESIKEVTRLLEQERKSALTVYNAREELLKSQAELQDKFKQVQMENQQLTINTNNLQASNLELSKKNKKLTDEQLQKEREIMQLTLGKNYADSSIMQLQDAVEKISKQLEQLKQENLQLITEKSELAGELNAFRRANKKD